MTGAGGRDRPGRSLSRHEPGLAELLAAEAAIGLDPADRVAMRRPAG